MKQTHKKRDEVGFIDTGEILYLTGKRAKNCPMPKTTDKTRKKYIPLIRALKHSVGIGNYKIGILCWLNCPKDCLTKNKILRRMKAKLKNNK